MAIVKPWATGIEIGLATCRPLREMLRQGRPLMFIGVSVKVLWLVTLVTILLATLYIPFMAPRCYLIFPRATETFLLTFYGYYIVIKGSYFLLLYSLCCIVIYSLGLVDF